MSRNAKTNSVMTARKTFWALKAQTHDAKRFVNVPHHRFEPGDCLTGSAPRTDVDWLAVVVGNAAEHRGSAFHGDLPYRSRVPFQKLDLA